MQFRGNPNSKYDKNYCQSVRKVNDATNVKHSAISMIKKQYSGDGFKK